MSTILSNDIKKNSLKIFVVNTEPAFVFRMTFSWTQELQQEEPQQCDLNNTNKIKPCAASAHLKNVC